jgi:hypothetical protein
MCILTRVILLAFLVIGHITYGQSTDSISKIIFTYSKGHSSWGNPGIYGKSEYIEYSPSSNGQFRLTRFLRVTYSVGLDGKTFHEDTIRLTTNVYSSIDRRSIQNWLTQLNTHKDNYTKTFVEPWLTKPTRKEVNTTARTIRNEFFFDRDFREEKQNVIRKIRNFCLLDSFLISTKPNFDLMLVTHAWDVLKIKVIANSDTAFYRSQFLFNALGQPISRNDHNDINRINNIINLDTNIYARAFLPKKSLAYKVLNINNLKRDFTLWWLEKDGLIF